MRSWKLVVSQPLSSWEDDKADIEEMLGMEASTVNLGKYFAVSAFYYADKEDAEDASDMLQQEFEELALFVMEVWDGGDTSGRMMNAGSSPLTRVQILLPSGRNVSINFPVSHVVRRQVLSGKYRVIRGGAGLDSNAEAVPLRSEELFSGRRRHPSRLGCGGDGGGAAQAQPVFLNIIKPRVRVTATATTLILPHPPKRSRASLRARDYTVRIDKPFAVVYSTSKPAQSYVSRKIKKLLSEGYPQKQAVAIALNMARREGYKV